MRSTFKWTFLTIALCPIVFLFAMMQMSQISVPFWDHWETAYFLSRYYEEGGWVAFMHSLTFMHNHTRPAILRAILIPNAILTRWNVSSEYIYVYLAMAATLFTHYRIIKKIDREQPLDFRGALALSLIAIIYCSPANHNNHWWSFMLQLVMSNAFTVIALSAIAFDPRGWRSNILAAAMCWLSIFTLTNGLFALIVVAMIAQLGGERPLRPNRITAFWVLNAVLIYLIYFPIHEASAKNPTIVELLHFTLAYIGAPMAALMHFSYDNMFEPPASAVLATICGAVLLALSAWIALIYRGFWRTPPAHFLIFIGFGAYALLSAAGTGWGRVNFDAYGMRNATASRYIITGSYVLFALVYFIYAERQTFLRRIFLGWADRVSPAVTRSALAVLYVVFLAASTNAYAHSIFIYKQARDLNTRISAGFLPDASDSAVDASLYPNQERLRMLRGYLLRYHLGPYRGDAPK